LAFNIQPTKSEPTTIIVPDDYEKIQWAIDNASNGDIIFVRTGTYYEHVVLSKSVLLIGEDKDSTVIDGSESYHVVRITADYVTITNFTIRNSRHQYADDSAIRIDRHSHNIIKGNMILNSLVSIYLNNAHNNTICDNEIIAPSQWYTIWLKQSHHNIIQKNLITNNSGSGIILWSSNWNTVNGNNVTGIPTLPTANGQGIVLYAGSHSNVVSNNRLVYNKYSGVSLMESEGNVIQDNIMEHNYLGIYSWKSSNIIHRNTVSNNDWYGIILSQSNGSIIYHNNFLNNRVSGSPAYDNTWDDGYPSGGNYWSDYTGSDLYGGLYQNETGSDGIGDTPYVIDENNRDHYPLMSPWEIPAAVEEEKEEAIPLWTQWWFWAIIIAGIGVSAEILYFLKKRKPPTHTPPLSAESTV
jgi:parallel beta-helix repeat protein